MTRNSIALRSVTAAAIVGLPLGVSPIALTQGSTTISSAAAAPVSMIDRTEDTLTIHKQGNVDACGEVIGPFNPLDLTGNGGCAQ